MTNVERVLALIRSTNGLTDREIGERTGVSPHAQVNQICNRLAKKGLTRRERGPGGILVNRPIGGVDDGRVSVPAGARTKKPLDGPVGSLEIEPGSTLVVIPCSSRKHTGGVEGVDGASILDLLPEGLSDELRNARKRNARACQLDESLWMAAVGRYCGTLYESAGRTVEQLCKSVAGLAVVSGGYGVVLGREQIGWYGKSFEQAMWPDNLVGRCLSAYAKAIGATTAVGLFGATTPYAKAFRRTEWPREVHEAWLVSPEGGDGALVKVPRAIGEALVEIESTGMLAADWKSSNGLGMRFTRVGAGATQVAVVGADEAREGQSSSVRGRTSTGEAPHARTPHPPSRLRRRVGGDGSGEIRIALDKDDARRLDAARSRFIKEVAGADEAAAAAMADAVTREGFAGYLLRRAIGEMDRGGD